MIFLTIILLDIDIQLFLRHDYGSSWLLFVYFYHSTAVFLYHEFLWKVYNSTLLNLFTVLFNISKLARASNYRR